MEPKVTSDYNNTATSQGDLNRMLAANMYVTDVLEGATNNQESISEKKLIPRDWKTQTGAYDRVGVDGRVNTRPTPKMLKTFT